VDRNAEIEIHSGRRVEFDVATDARSGKLRADRARLLSP
jgi:hypothetical protein